MATPCESSIRTTGFGFSKDSARLSSLGQAANVCEEWGCGYGAELVPFSEWYSWSWGMWKHYGTFTCDTLGGGGGGGGGDGPPDEPQ